MPVVYIREDTRLPERAKNDFYETDCGTVTRALWRLRDRLGDLPAVALDPGAGRGVWGIAYQHLQNGACLTGVEIDPELRKPFADRALPGPYDFWHTGDFLAWQQPRRLFGAVIGNPPYHQAEAFVRHSLALVRPGGAVYFLLKLTFLAGQARRDGLYREHPLKECLVLSKRPSFQQDGHSAPDEYGMFLWERGWQGKTELSRL